MSEVRLQMIKEAHARWLAAGRRKRTAMTEFICGRCREARAEPRKQLRRHMLCAVCQDSWFEHLDAAAYTSADDNVVRLPLATDDCAEEKLSKAYELPPLDPRAFDISNALVRFGFLLIEAGEVYKP